MARSKSPKAKCVNDRELIVGIDVAKRQHIAHPVPRWERIATLLVP